MLYFIAFAISLVVSVFLTPRVLKWAKRRGFVDKPDPRKIHKTPIPRLGGIAVFSAFWITIIFFQIFFPEKLIFTENKILGIDQNLFGVFIGSLIVFLSGILDDIKNLKPFSKLFWQIVAGTIIVIFGINIWWVHNPFGGENIILNNLTYILVPVWIVLLINVMNWWDGIDGQVTGIGIIAAIVLFFLSISKVVNQPSTAILMIVLAGSSFGFLKYNFFPARIFIGDSGSQFIGFMLAIGAIISGGKLATAALVLGFPILDAFWVISRRLLNGKKIWSADRSHLHHRLLDLGF
ncbi:MAG: glycosyl transferase, partial [Candidatus Berkelbacteria bacterium Licking1014_85]